MFSNNSNPEVGGQSFDNERKAATTPNTENTLTNKVMEEKKLSQNGDGMSSPAQNSNDSATPQEKAAGAVTLLERGKIYTSTELSNMGVKLAKLGDNRDVDSRAVAKKVKSIKEANGIISPCLIVLARTCLEQNHTVALWSGEEVTLDTEGVDSIFVIIDGQHREDAKRKIDENKQEATKYENYYALPMTEDFKITDVLREVNTCTYPWKDRQYLQNLVSLKDGNGTDLDFLKEILNHPMATTKAMVHWLSLDANKTIYSSAIVKAMIDDNKLKEIVDVDRDTFEAGKELFNTVLKKFDNEEKLVGTTTFSDFAISKIKSSGKVAVVEAAKEMTRFFASLKPDFVNKVKKAKGSKDSGTTKTDAIKEYLETKYNWWKSVKDKVASETEAEEEHQV